MSKSPSMSRHLTRVRQEMKAAFRKRHFAKYRYLRNWLKAHAALQREVRQ